MNKFFNRFFLGCVIICVFNISSLAQRNWLGKSASLQQVHTYLLSIDNWRQVQVKSVKDKLNQLPDSVKQKLLKNAEQVVGFDWPNLPATIYLQFAENGNRTNYETIRRKRRNVLSALVIGELIEQKGQFMPNIINGIWAICEESTWAYPAHLYIQKKYSALPNPTETTIDLGAASTAELMSWTYLLLQKKLNKVSPVLPNRIRYELKRRIVSPYLNRNDYWWMGFESKFVNNWNPTVNNGVLLTALLTVNNQARLDSIVYKTMKSVDHFLNQYPEMGGCDEGPGYWSMAGGAFISYLSKLKSASNGKISIANHSLIGDMGRYIYKVNINKNYFVNYGDAHAKVTPNVISIFEYGEACNIDTLKYFAAWFAKEKGSVYDYLVEAKNSLTRFVDYLQIYQAINQSKAMQPLIKQSWLPDLQQLTIRSKAGSATGLFLAAKGGNNGASHNHNDVGNFIIYANGKPAIIDLGVGTYTKQTFSSDRYKIFTMQSAWHNLPSINGVMQNAGKQYKATGVKVNTNKKQTVLSMDIAAAYPQKAAVKSWNRTLRFSKNNIVLSEKYSLQDYKHPTTLSLITPAKVVVNKNELLLVDADGHTILHIAYNAKKLTVAVTQKILNDKSLIHSWGDAVNKIEFKVLSTKLSGSYQLRFYQ